MTEYQKTELEWTRKDTGHFFALTMILIIISTATSATCFLMASAGKMLEAVILAIVASILWRKVLTNAKTTVDGLEKLERSEDEI